jgi:hypothetical protein
VKFHISLFFIILISQLGLLIRAEADPQLVSVKVETSPSIDGLAQDPQWSNVESITTTDSVAGIEIRLKSVHTENVVFFLVQFPDTTENRGHKTQVWNAEKGLYETGHDREDTFLFKWNMEPYPSKLTIAEDTPYIADIWFWKALRTDPMGYADDKMHIYSPVNIPKAKRLLSRGGRVFFLARPGDEGEAAYAPLILSHFEKPQMPMYENKTPTNSRADVHARGIWRDGYWTIEFARKMRTNHKDDVEFEIDRSYQFGVSRYEIAGRKINRTLDQPEYGAGEIGERLSLVFN